MTELFNMNAFELQEIVLHKKDLDQKSFALSINDLRKDLQSLLFTIRKGDDARETVVKQLLRNNKTNKAITELLQHKRWPLWTFSFFQEE